MDSRGGEDTCCPPIVPKRLVIPSLRPFVCLAGAPARGIARRLRHQTSRPLSTCLASNKARKLSPSWMEVSSMHIYYRKSTKIRVKNYL
ncbi:hypothetical protein M408DRAFT_331602 [Serendipita vermifera MAFF 305830]|uniref:Uncharacterized protein n=1 Tax=Serendipita vermifera MAFF 305830 TaxID=933852 RepID=A0A0C2WEA2_SERVB|nr:hypothetical protein M408DRAFT_331602 [Serendipita vermifera MAFF 305830]